MYENEAIRQTYHHRWWVLLPNSGLSFVGITGDNHGVALSDFLLNGADLAYMKPITPSILREIFLTHLLPTDNSQREN